ncbi:MAG: MurR/RpiR family transcriptional regulator [Spirochaetaceae bacterium]|nr:MurR/RpiR family transcriptional regulator [Spirochaetaceae bacterium]
MDVKLDWLDRLRRFENDLSRAESDLLRYVNANPEKVSLLTQRELAVAADVSKPVVISLFRKLGYSTHKEFQHSVEEFFSTHIDSYRASQHIRNQFETLEELISEAIQVDTRSLERLSQSLSPGTLGAMVEAITGHERVWIIGPGTAMYPAHYLSQRLRRYQIASVLIGQDSSHHLDELFPITERDLLLVFHYSDRDEWLLPVLKFAGDRGALRMLVSATIHPSYVDESDEFLHVPRGELHFKNSMAVPMAFANLLLLALEIARGEDVRERLKNLEKARNDWETALRDKK